MKYLLTAILPLALVVGCSQNTSGGPGATRTTPEGRMDKVDTTISQPANTFSLDVPMMATSVKRGETKALAIGIDRGSNMDQNVTLSFQGLPQGVTIEPNSPTIQATNKEAQFMVTAGPAAPIGEFTAKVVGHPATGPDAMSDLKINVTEQ
jgi:hypothetical protein